MHSIPFFTILFYFCFPVTIAAKIEYGEIPALEAKIKENSEKWDRMQKEGTLLRNSVEEESIASIVSKWTGIPVNKMMASEKQKVLKVEEVLKKDVIGQDEAIKAISRAIKRNKADRVPKVGIFWIINDEVISFMEDLRLIKPVMGFRDSEFNHYSMWSKLRLRGDYTSKPRGRVIYNDNKEKFFVYLPSTLIKDRSVINKVLKTFNVPTSKALLKTDDHYEMDEISELDLEESWM